MAPTEHYASEDKGYRMSMTQRLKFFSPPLLNPSPCNEKEF